MIWDLHSGLLEFLRTVFPGARSSIVNGQVFRREPMGRGAHFDVYDELLHMHYPWVGLFNLAGDAVVTVCQLPDQIAKTYASAFRQASDDAYEERRRLADDALADSRVESRKGLLLPNCGLIIPQQLSGPDWIHKVVPTSEQNPGRFVKFAVVHEKSAGFLQYRGVGAISTKAIAMENRLSTELPSSHGQAIRL